MRLTAASTILTLSTYTLLSHALPLSPNKPVERQLVPRKVAYSVVAVDGGPSTAVPTQTKFETKDTTETVTAPASTIPASTETIISTLIVSESDTTKTVVVTMTADSASSTDLPSPSDSPSSSDSPSPAVPIVTPAVATAALAETTATATSIATVTNNLVVPADPAIVTDYAQSTATHDVVVPADPATVTAYVQPTVTQSYDDGQYHTTYPVWNSTSSTMISSSTTTSDVEYTQVPSLNGTYYAPTPASDKLRRHKKPSSSTTPKPTPSPTSSLPPLPELPKLTSEDINPTEIPTINVAEMHEVPGFDRR